MPGCNGKKNKRKCSEMSEEVQQYIDAVADAEGLATQMINACGDAVAKSEAEVERLQEQLRIAVEALKSVDYVLGNVWAIHRENLHAEVKDTLQQIAALKGE